ncbi:MAG TPA: HAD family hydrolase [Microbacteriaceae bacterium]|jgi:Cof subfamily protein (haloacid dehalogenase superfamily)|nr:5-amino-6-(5-phospho-D-ribitylamino)uracil phosphatase [Microbacteriaceae bacterium]HEV7565060.1 HAD family hydrolase [Microbacteriaceae bacterium]
MGEGDRLLVALDVDGTLIHEDESISPKVRAEVTRVQGLGHEVMLATGRSWETAQPILEHFGLESEFVVCANGALTMKRDPSEPSGYRREHIETFDPREVLELIRPHLPRGSFMVEDATGFRRYTEGMSQWELANGVQVPFERLAELPATRVVVISPHHDEEQFLSVVERMGLHKVSYSIGWTAWLDIAPDGVNKSTALERVRGRLGIERSRVVAVGDGRNDIDMLQWAGAEGRSVAMGQAPEDVIAAAAEVTAPVGADGVAQFLATL